MVKARSKKPRRAVASDDSSSQTSLEFDFGEIPPIVPEPPDTPDTCEFQASVPGMEELLAVDMHLVRQRTKRIIATGKTTRFFEWVKEEPYFLNHKNGVRRPEGYALRKAILSHFLILFPGYIPPARAGLTYVPVFSEDINTFLKLEDSERWTCSRKNFYDAIRLKQPSMRPFLRGALIHPALGVFPGKDSSVFQWNIHTHYRAAKFNGRQFTPEELKWPAFYPPLSRVRITILNQYMVMIARPTFSPIDEFGLSYISIKDVLLWIPSWLHTPLTFAWWSKLPHHFKCVAVKSYAARSGRKIEVQDGSRFLARQLARVDPSLPFPEDIVSNPIKNHPESRKGCRKCVQCAMEVRARVLDKIFENFITHDAPGAVRTKLIYADVIPVGQWFKGLVNVAPYTYYLETTADGPQLSNS